MFAIKTTVTDGGRLIIPASIRKKMEIHTGDEVLVKYENQMIKIFNLQHAVKEAQAIVAKYNPRKINLSQALIAERRKEAHHE